MPGYYDPWTVVASFLIAFLAGFVAFESVDHTRFSARPRLWAWLGGVTLGLGIWSMHFLGMLAWHPPFPLYYSLGRTVISVLVAVAASSLALQQVTRNVSRRPITTKAVGALLVGSGICAMHYIGMSGLHFSGPVMWHARWVILSFLIAITASWGAMELLDRHGTGRTGLRHQLGASIVIALAICGMHYVGMLGFMPADGSICLHLPWSASGPTLAKVGVGNAMLITLGLLIVSHHDKAVWIQMVSEARLEAQESARKLEAMAAAGKIAASVAHEINNPLEAVMNLLYLVETGEVGNAELGHLATAQAELRRIAAITTHTLKFYRQQSAPTRVSIPDLFDSALTLFQAALDRSGIHIKKDWPEDIPSIVCREGEIRQVIANLVSNAIDAMPSGGSLHLGIAPEPEGVLVAIADTGPGIAPDVRDKVMEPFFTTKGIRGTGLGLSISSEIIARHGGTFSFSSRNDAPHSGTRFEFFLPCKPASALFLGR